MSQPYAAQLPLQICPPMGPREHLPFPSVHWWEEPCRSVLLPAAPCVWLPRASSRLVPLPDAGAAGLRPDLEQQGRSRQQHFPFPLPVLPAAGLLPQHCFDMWENSLHICSWPAPRDHVLKSNQGDLPCPFQHYWQKLSIGANFTEEVWLQLGFKHLCWGKNTFYLNILCFFRMACLNSLLLDQRMNFTVVFISKAGKKKIFNELSNSLDRVKPHEEDMCWTSASQWLWNNLCLHDLISEG